MYFSGSLILLQFKETCELPWCMELMKTIIQIRYHYLCFFFFQTQDVAVENVTAENATVRPENPRFQTPHDTHFEMFADRLNSQTSTGHIHTKCTFQPGEKCVIKGLLPFANYRIRLRACDQSSSCSGFRVGKGFRTLGDGKSFYRYGISQNQCDTWSTTRWTSALKAELFLLAVLFETV